MSRSRLFRLNRVRHLDSALRRQLVGLRIGKTMFAEHFTRVLAKYWRCPAYGPGRFRNI